MRVLLIVSELPPVTSGVARSVDRLRRGLIERGHSVDAVSSSTEFRWYVREFRIPFGARRLVRYGRVVAPYDVVGLHGPSPFYSDTLLSRAIVADGVARLRGSRRPPPMVYTHHFSVVVDGVRRLCGPYNAVHRGLARFADEVVVTTPSYRDQLQRAGVAEPHIVPWAADVERLAAPPDLPVRPLRVLCVGQMRPYKGVPILLRAAAGLAGVSVTIAGGGPEEQNYRDLAVELGGDNIEFVGRVSDTRLARLRREHHVMVLPSINEMEAFGIVLVEGMASAMVPVGADLPGVRDVFAGPGLGFRCGDPADLRRVLVGLRDDPDDVQSRRSRALTTSAEYTWDRSIDKYEAVLRAAIAARRGIRGEQSSPNGVVGGGPVRQSGRASQ